MHRFGLCIITTGVAYFSVGASPAFAWSVCDTSPNHSNLYASNAFTYTYNGATLPFLAELDDWGLDPANTPAANEQLCVASQSFYPYTVGTTSTAGGSLGFPNILNGGIWGKSTSDFNPNSLGKHFPVQVSSITSMPIVASISGTANAQGTWNASVEFFATTGKPSGTPNAPNGIELMVTFNMNTTGYDPAGLAIMGQASIAGTLWDVYGRGQWGGSNGSWNYFVYMPACGAPQCGGGNGDPTVYSRVLTQISADFKPFFDDAVTRSGASSGSPACVDPAPTSPETSTSCLDTSWWITAAQTGFELLGNGSATTQNHLQNGTGLAVTNFQINVNGSNPAVGPVLNGKIAAFTDNNGLVDIVYPEYNGALKYAVECPGCSGGWSGETDLGATASQMAIAQQVDGTLTAFYNDPTHGYGLSFVRQNGSGSGNFGAPVSLGGAAKNVAVLQEVNGLLEVFYIDNNTSAIRYKYQCWDASCTNGFSAEQTVPGATGVKQLALGYDPNLNLEVFYTDANNNLKSSVQTGNASWNAVHNFTSETASQIVSVMNGVFFIDASTGALKYNFWNGSSWDNVRTISGVTAKRFAMGTDPSSGLVRLLYVGTDNRLHMTAESTAGVLTSWTAPTTLPIYVKDVFMVNDYVGPKQWAICPGVDGSIQTVAIQSGSTTTGYVTGPVTWPFNAGAGRAYVVSP
jgi:hypothetical protein